MRLSISQSMKRYDVTKDELFIWLNYLRIIPHEEKNKQFLDDIQVSYMDELNEYIKQNGKMEGFSISKPSEIGGAEEPVEAPAEEEQQIQESATPLESNSELTQKERLLAHIPEDERKSVDKEVQREALPIYLARLGLRNHYIYTGEFTDPDVRQCLEQLLEQSYLLREQKLAEFDPNEFAQLL